jgi:pimeloyl-ACP methyl ester carboxylesterase
VGRHDRPGGERWQPREVARLVLVDSAGVGYFAEEQMEGISCPTLVVWGEDDTVLPLSDAAWFGATIPGSRVEVISGVTEQEGVPEWGGHHPMRFKPQEFNQILLDFLPKHYALTMLPYPGRPAHRPLVRHGALGCRARYMRMQGYNVFFPHRL